MSSRHRVVQLCLVLLGGSSAGAQTSAGPLLESVYAQGGLGQATLSAGASQSSPQEITPVRSASVGLGVESRMMRGLSVAVEAAYVSGGARFYESGGRGVRLRSTHLQSTIAGRMRIGRERGLYARPQIGGAFRVLGQRDFADEATGNVFAQADMKKTELTAMFGVRAGHSRMSRVELDFRYHVGLTDASRGENKRSRFWFAMVSYAFLRR